MFIKLSLIVWRHMQKQVAATEIILVNRIHSWLVLGSSRELLIIIQYKIKPALSFIGNEKS